MKKYILLSLLFLSVFVVSLLAHLPAALVVKHAPLPAQLAIEGVSGTLWQGQASQVNWQRRSLGPLSWQWQPSRLIEGKLAAQLRLSGKESDYALAGRGEVGLSLSGAYAQNLLASLPASAVIKQLPLPPLPVELGGQVEINIRHWQYQPPYCEAGEATLVWNSDRIASPLGDLELGPVIADVRCQQQQINLQGEQSSDQVVGGFAVEVDPNGRYNASGWFKPQAAFPPAMNAQLPWLGNPDGKGRYQFQQQGAL
ncbi:type II secretion system protein N [Vibrio sp.]|uniref:type II secretion system protein N n=1 Tax=Vibrio sp. TaxID=678 RepID=UPI003D0EE67C